MAKQAGLIKIKGTIGDLSFYESQDGHLVRFKGGISKERIKNDANFARTRENNSEFGRACEAGKLLRTAFRRYVNYASDKNTVARLSSRMLEVVKADATSTRGLRNVLDGELELLQGFDFNIKSELKSSFYSQYAANIDRVLGEARVNILPFIPANMVASPVGATHCQLVSAGAEIDFENKSFTVATSESSMIQLDNNLTQDIILLSGLPANSTHPLFLILGINYFQEVNGAMYPLNDFSFNALSLVRVSGL
jgi:hypothetical protein